MTQRSRIAAGLGAWLCALPAAASPPSAAAEVVTHRELERTWHAWHPTGFRRGGASFVTFEVPDGPRRRGSLEQVLDGQGGPEAEAAVEILAPDVWVAPGQGLRADGDGFGRLADLAEASFAWWRDPTSTAPRHFSTALRLFVHDPEDGPQGSTWELVWEPVYNGYPPDVGVPVSTWIRSDAAQGVVWRRPLYIGGAPAPADACDLRPELCHRYDRRPTEWGFGPKTVVVGLGLAVGSGWPGTYRGFADAVVLSFRGGPTHRWNFEPMGRGKRGRSGPR